MSNLTHPSITILQLYPRDMNIYGDNGNVLVLKRRLEWRGFKANIISYNVGDSLPKNVDIIVGGGGQDSGQAKVHADLIKIGAQLKNWAEDGVPILMVCGLYQLFGNFFETSDKNRLEGIGIFDIETYGTTERLIGNIVTSSDKFGEIVGYENHSGQTYLKEGSEPFARVIRGAGNNSSEGHEGAVYHNVIGTYLHGSLLPKNPAVADFLIETALTRKGLSVPEDIHIDDSIAHKARRVAIRSAR